jgi:hypothetical protein
VPADMSLLTVHFGASLSHVFFALCRLTCLLVNEKFCLSIQLLRPLEVQIKDRNMALLKLWCVLPWSVLLNYHKECNVECSRREELKKQNKNADNF